MLLAAAAFGGLCGGAEAATVAWNLHDPLEFGVGVKAPGAFGDAYTLSIAGAPVLNRSSVVANNNLPAYSILAGASYSLRSFGADNLFSTADDLNLGTWNYDGTTGTTTHAVGLSAGNYYFSVNGNAVGSTGGRYILVSSVAAVAPVPIPANLAMMTAGLMLMGFLARRKGAKTRALPIGA